MTWSGPWSRAMAWTYVPPPPKAELPAAEYDSGTCAFDHRHSFTALRGARHDGYCSPACRGAAVRRAMFRQRREGSQP